MNRKNKNLIGLIEHRLGAVAVMHLDIKDKNPLQAIVPAEILDGRITVGGEPGRDWPGLHR